MRRENAPLCWRKHSGPPHRLGYNRAMSESGKKPQRPVRSFVIRGGRLTPGQQRAIDDLYPRLGVPAGDAPLDFKTLFGRRAPTVLEIGFGNGESTWRMAQSEPETNFLAVEVHPPGVGRLLLCLDKEAVTNVRVHQGDAVEFMSRRVADASLQGVRIYFPDPWHKKRHHKRRLIQPPFVAQLADKLAPGGLLHLATDWVPYAEHMLEVLEAATALTNCAGDGGFSPRPPERPRTKFEARGERLGHGVWDLLYRRHDTD